MKKRRSLYHSLFHMPRGLRIAINSYETSKCRGPRLDMPTTFGSHGRRIRNPAAQSGRHVGMHVDKGVYFCSILDC